MNPVPVQADVDDAGVVVAIAAAAPAVVRVLIRAGGEGREAEIFI